MLPAPHLNPIILDMPLSLKFLNAPILRRIKNSPALSAACVLCVTTLIFLHETRYSLFSQMPYATPIDTWMIGEYLYYGLHSPHISNNMPMSSLCTALIQHHIGTTAQAVANIALLTVSFLLTFQLGRLLFSPAAGLLAAAMASALNLFHASGDIEDRLYAAIFLLTATLLAWAARRPTFFRNALLGTGIGLSLLIRSPLILLPPVLVAWAWLRTGEKIKKTRFPPRAALPLLLAPLLILLPWIAMNFQVHKRFIPLADRRIEMNLAAGALGWVEAVEGHGFVKEAGLENSPWLWYARESLSHPIRSITAFFLRFIYFFSIHPLLILLATFSLFRYRKRPDHQQVGLLIIYFIATHCLVAVSTSYFTHVWPTIAVLAGGALLAPFHNPARPQTHPPPMMPVWIGLFFFALLGTGALTLAMAYPLRSIEPLTGLNRVISAGAQNPWLYTERGRLNMKHRNPHAAAKDFSKALSLRPHPTTLIDYAWALLASNSAAGGLIESISIDPLEFNDRRQALFLKTIYTLENGKTAQAQLEFNASRKAGMDGCLVPESLSPHAKQTMQDVCGIGLVHRMRLLLAPWPPKKRATLMNHFISWSGGLPKTAPPPTPSAPLKKKLPPPSLEQQATIRLAAAQDAITAKEEISALTYLQDFNWAAQSQPIRQKAAFLFVKLNRSDLARPLLKDLPETPSPNIEILIAASSAAAEDGREADAEKLLLQAADNLPSLGFSLRSTHFFAKRREDKEAMYLELARHALKLKRPSIALHILSRIKKKVLSPAHTLRMAQIYMDAQQPAKALKRIQPLLLENPRYPEALILHARAAHQNGDPDAAHASLGKALKTPLTSQRRIHIAQIFQAWGNSERAIQILAPLHTHTDSAVAAQAWYETGINQFLLKRPEETKQSLRRALNLAPDLKEARESLKALTPP